MEPPMRLAGRFRAFATGSLTSSVPRTPVNSGLATRPLYADGDGREHQLRPVLHGDGDAFAVERRDLGRDAADAAFGAEHGPREQRDPGHHDGQGQCPPVDLGHIAAEAVHAATRRGSSVRGGTSPGGRPAARTAGR